MAQLIRTISRFVTFTPVTSNGVAYTASDQIGVANTVAGVTEEQGSTATLFTAIIIDKDKQKAALTLHFFDQIPAAVVADNAAYDVSDAEQAAHFLGSCDILVSDYKDCASNSIATSKNIGALMKTLPGDKNVYCLIQTTGTPTYASVASLVVKLGFVVD